MIDMTQNSQSLSSQGSCATYLPSSKKMQARGTGNKSPSLNPPFKKRKPLEEVEVDTQQVQPSNIDSCLYDKDKKKENNKGVREVQEGDEEDIDEGDDEANEYY